MNPRARTIGLTLLLVFSVLIQLLVWRFWFPAAARGMRSDFGEFYAAGTLVRSGHSDQMYDDAAQQQIQNRAVPDQNPKFIPYLHLPYEALIFVPLVGFSYRSAFFLFVTFGLASTAVCLYMLAQGRWAIAVLIAFTFLPLSVGAVCGQDSLLLLLILTVSWAMLKRKNEGVAGLVAGMGLFRFQIIIPVALLFLLWRRWRFVGGVAISSAGLLLISLAMVGPHEFRHYLRDIAGEAAGVGYSENNTYNIGIYGFVMTAGKALSVPVIRVLVLVISLLLIVIRYRRKPGNASEALESALPVALLVGVHVHFYDAAVLAISTAPMVAQGRASWPVWLLYAATSIAVLNPSWTFVLAVPLAMLLIWQSALLGARRVFPGAASA